MIYHSNEGDSMFTVESAMEKYPNIPENTIRQLERFVLTGCPCGHFLTAVLSKDLFEAVSRADPENQASLVNLVKLIWNEVPMSCYGTDKKVQAWSDKHDVEELAG